eukprot:scaffold1190_cov187-Ochromonas_danica.AAC.10
MSYRILPTSTSSLQSLLLSSYSSRQSVSFPFFHIDFHGIHANVVEEVGLGTVTAAVDIVATGHSFVISDVLYCTVLYCSSSSHMT